MLYVKPISIRPKFLYIALGNFGHGGAFLVRALYKLIVNIGKILNKAYLITSPLKIAAQNVKNAKRARVAYVNVVINRRSAGVNFNLALGYRLKFILFPCQGVKYPHWFPLPVYYLFSSE